MNDFFDSLNPRQRDAVFHQGGALVLAGAGTGKTRVLTGRIIHLLTEKQAAPRDILAVTFTNKAAREMRLRVETMLPTPPQGLLLGTFHSICHRILRIHATTAGLSKDFQILDTQDQQTFIRRLMKDRSISEQEFPPKDVRSYIAAAKEKGMRAAHVPVAGERQQSFADIYKLYEDACRRENKLDFAELMLATMDLWRTNNDLCAHYAERFRHILIDELQDTNRQQFEWLQLLDSGDNAFFAVGDDDQSIYAFRGAEPKIMQHFQGRFRAGTLIRLEENYRSVKNILSIANGLIDRNRERLGKSLTTQEGDGEPIAVRAADSDLEEASEVAVAIQQHIDDGGAADDMAVLYRTNAQARLFERALTENGTPYRIYGGLRFYDRMEVKHALAYLRLVLSDDRDALLRAINTPPRGIGSKTIADLLANGQPFVALQTMENTKVQAFRFLLNNLRAQRETLGLGELMKEIVEKSGLLTHYEKRQEEERAENLRELVNAGEQFQNSLTDETNTEDSDAPTAFLATVALESGGDENETRPTVSLMTVHAAKGLEFKRVFVVGLEEGLFPHSQSLDSPNPRDIEEERRLLYVAITRARRSLSLHFAQQRMLYGRQQSNLHSRFLDELPTAHLKQEKWQPIPQYVPPADKGFHTPRRAPPIAVQRFADAEAKEGFRPGESVSHRRYGKGVVVKHSGSGKEAEVQVAFKKYGIKTFKAALVPLEKL